MIRRWWGRLDRRGKVIVALVHAAFALVVAALVITWDTYWSQYVVQNVFPPSVWTLVGIAWAQLRVHARLDKQDQRASERHEDLKQHVSATAGGRDGNDH